MKTAPARIHLTVALGVAYGALVLTMVSLSYVKALDDFYLAGRPKDNPIESISRASKRIIVIVGLVLICASFAGESPLSFRRRAARPAQGLVFGARRPELPPRLRAARRLGAGRRRAGHGR